MEMEDGDTIIVSRGLVISTIWDSTNDSEVGSLLVAGQFDRAH